MSESESLVSISVGFFHDFFLCFISTKLIGFHFCLMMDNCVYRETSSIKVNDIASQIADNVGAAVEATNSLPAGARDIAFHYNRQNPKRRRLMETISLDPLVNASDVSSTAPAYDLVQHGFAEDERKVEAGQNINSLCDSDKGPVSLSKMVAVLCEQHLFLPLLRAFEIFLPSCSLLPFVRALQVK